MSHDYAIITHPIYREHETGGHPECSDRLRVIERAICEDSELMAVCDRIEPGLATRDDVLRCHTEAHIALLAAARGKEGYFDPDTIHSPESVDAAYRAAGAAIHAVKAVVEGDTKAAFALVRPPGHHACRPPCSSRPCKRCWWDVAQADELARCRPALPHLRRPPSPVDRDRRRTG